MIGQTISHYRILEQVGKGGMGTVFRAEDTRLHRPVALKFLHSDLLLDEREKTRFLHEAEAAAKLGHPNIATVYDVDERVDPGTSTRYAFIAMEYVTGESLRRKIDRGPLGPEEITSIARQLASALQAAHRHGIVHRDVKPANILVQEDGSVKVLDFGVAKLAGETRVTMAGQVVGSVAYMSPEQLRGEDVDARSDIWSFGVVLYEMITGRFPFRGDHTAAVVYAITNEEPLPIESLRAGLPPSLASLCEACLRKDAAERPSTMDAVLSMLEGETAARPKKKRSASGRVSRLWRPAAAISIAALVLVLLLLMFPSLRGSLARLIGIGGGGPVIVAVVPFTPLGDSAVSQAECAGLAWILSSRITELTQGSGSLSVIHPGDVKRYRVTNAEDARAFLGASFVITGSYQRIAEVLRVTVELVDASTARSRNSYVGTYLQGSGYRVMEDDLMTHVSDWLDLHSGPLSGRLPAGETADDEAHQYYVQGRGYLQQYDSRDNVQFAVGLFRKALGRDSTYALARAALGESYWRMYGLSKDTVWIGRAKLEAARVIASQPMLSEAHLTAGMISAGTGRYEEAVTEFRTALFVDPRNPAALRSLADAYARLEDFARAESTYKQAIAMSPSYWAGYSALGAFYSERGRYEDASREFRKVTELTPDNYRGFSNLGAMALYQGAWSEARAAFERSVQLRPTAAAYSNLGAALFYEKQYGESSRAYEKALTLDSNDYRVWANLASALYWIPGERERSRPAYRRAAERAERERSVDPRDHVVLSHLANFYGILGDSARAVALAEEALRLSNNDPETLERAAETFLFTGDRRRAVSVLVNAIAAGFSPGLLRLNPAFTEIINEPAIVEQINRTTRSTK